MLSLLLMTTPALCATRDAARRLIAVAFYLQSRGLPGDFAVELVNGGKGAGKKQLVRSSTIMYARLSFDFVMLVSFLGGFAIWHQTDSGRLAFAAGTILFCFGFLIAASIGKRRKK